MGMADRDWYREGVRQRWRAARAEAAASGPPNPRDRQHGRRPPPAWPPPWLRRHGRLVATIAVVILSALLRGPLGPEIIARTRNMLSSATAEVPHVTATNPPDFVPEGFPPNGYQLWHIEVPDIAWGPLAVIAPVTGGELHFVVRLRDWATDRPITTLFMTTGGYATTMLPVGAYRMTVASGEHWDGLARMFGAATRVTRSVDPVLIVPRRGGVVGATVNLEGSITGNFPVAPAGVGGF